MRRIIKTEYKAKQARVTVTLNLFGAYRATRVTLPVDPAAPKHEAMRLAVVVAWNRLMTDANMADGMIVAEQVYEELGPTDSHDECYYSVQ